MIYSKTTEIHESGKDKKSGPLQVLPDSVSQHYWSLFLASSRELFEPSIPRGCDTTHNGEIDFIEFVMWLPLGRLHTTDYSFRAEFAGEWGPWDHDTC